MSKKKMREFRNRIDSNKQRDGPRKKTWCCETRCRKAYKCNTFDKARDERCADRNLIHDDSTAHVSRLSDADVLALVNSRVLK